MIPFETLFKQHRGRRCSKWQHYFSVYDRHLFHLIGQEFTLLEIGVAQGGSLQLWKKYFGGRVSVVGIDLDPNSYFEEPQIRVFTGDQSDRVFLEGVLAKIGTPTVIIDDGSHIQSHIIKTHRVLYPTLTSNGVYIIEDCHTSYWPRFEGGVNSHLNAVEIFSKSSHDVNEKWYNVSRTPIIGNLDSISFYDSLIVMEKRENKYLRRMVDVDHEGPKIMETV